MIRGTLLILAVCVAAAACGDPDADVAVEPLLSFEVVASLDRDATSDRNPFGSVVDVEVSADGTIFVLDGLSRIISVFDATGTPVTSFGGRGRGPGELDRPAGLFWGANARLWVLDFGTARFTAFHPDGEVANTYRAAGPQPAIPLVVHVSGDTLLRGVGYDFEGGSLERPMAVMAEYRIGPGELDFVRAEELPFVEWPEVFEFSNDEVALLLPVPLSPQPMYTFDVEGRLWYGRAGPGHASRWAGDMDFDRTLGRDLPPLEVSREVAESLFAGDPDIDELRSLASPTEFQAFWERVPDTRPRLETLFAGDDGSMWLLRAGDSPASSERPIDWYGTDGELLGAGVVALDPLPTPRSRGLWLAGVTRDDLGVETVVLYRRSSPPS